QTQNKIIEELKLLKNTLIEKIFKGQLKFKDENGRDFPKWQIKMLGEIGDFQTSSIDKLSRDSEKEVYLVNYMNVYKHQNIDKKTMKSLQTVTAKESQIESCNLKRGDILFTPSSETPNDIGHSVVVFEDLKDVVFSYHLMRFRPATELDILYSHYFCNVPSVLHQLSKVATGSTRYTVSVKSFSKIEVSLPCKKEQNKIANFLSSVDLKIETEIKVFQKLIEQKAYFLAHLFI
ncbi:restriction endonuclease subunit S, partial [Chryseobacterium sp. CKR4-1]|uniref:restriction endonuclease subunit S n=1 Tax=Chryseobacterium sp. CKR4-1 TaxID=3068896 RepID=UPI002796C3CB